VLTSGDRIAADIVIVGVGVRPCTDFLRDSGITLVRDGGIRVNSYLQVEGHEHVFAGGRYTTFGHSRRCVRISGLPVQQAILPIFPVYILTK
jgi:NADPH-dependent 2,4-dienoyl-CoA reductase/sulfur reductase-like enzyme